MAVRGGGDPKSPRSDEGWVGVPVVSFARVDIDSAVKIDIKNVY
jgi:hypothetical protein